MSISQLILPLGERNSTPLLGLAMAAATVVVVSGAEVMVGPVPEGVPEPEQPAMAIAISGTAAVETDRDQTPDMAFMPTKTCPSPGRLQLPAHERLQQTRGGTAPGLMRNGRSDHPIVLRGH